MLSDKQSLILAGLLITGMFIFGILDILDNFIVLTILTSFFLMVVINLFYTKAKSKEADKNQ